MHHWIELINTMCVFCKIFYCDDFDDADQQPTGTPATMIWHVATIDKDVSTN